MPRILLVFLLLYAASSSAQQHKKLEDSPLIKFLQREFDSVLIHHRHGAWYFAPHFEIAVRFENKTTFYTYKSPYLSHPRGASKTVSNYFIERQIQFGNTVPDTNNYFLRVNLNKENTYAFWLSASNAGAWKLQNFRDSCRFTDVYDDDSQMFILITKQAIRSVNYYAPEFYETCAPGHPMRQKALTVLDVFRKSFTSAGCY